MLLLISTKNDNSLNVMIQTLFQNGYSTFRLADSVENLCTSCSNPAAGVRNGKQTNEVVLVLDIPEGITINNAIRILFENGYMSFVVAKSVEHACSNCKGSQSRAEVPSLEEATYGEKSSNYEKPQIDELLPSSSVSHEQKETTEQEDVNQTEGLETTEDVTKLGTYSLFLSTLLNSTSNTVDIVKEEIPEPYNSNKLIETSDRDSQNSSILEQFINLRSSLFSTQEPKSKSTRNKPRKLRLIPKSSNQVDVHECQLCGTKVTFGSDVRNFLKCADRHARLHATRKQYSCVECGAGFTRIDVVKQHISSHHKGSEVKYLDHGFELRDEYLKLSEQCFPKTEEIRRNLKKILK